MATTFNYNIEISRVKETPTRNVTFRVKVGGVTILDNQTAGTSGNVTLTGTVDLDAGTTPLEIQVYNDASNRSTSYWEGEGIKIEDITFKTTAILDADKSATEEYCKWVPTDSEQPSTASSNISYAGDGSFLGNITFADGDVTAVVSPQA